jgi:glutathione S-transferase
MSIRIRVYPQTFDVAPRRRRARRHVQQHIMQHRRQQAIQQQVLQQQMMQRYAVRQNPFALPPAVQGYNNLGYGGMSVLNQLFGQSPYQVNWTSQYAQPAVAGSLWGAPHTAWGQGQAFVPHQAPWSPYGVSQSAGWW